MALSITPIEKIEQVKILKDLIWKNRVLILLEKNNEFIDKAIKSKDEFIDRDFVVVIIDGNNTFINNYTMPTSFTQSIFNKLKNTDTDNKIILVGKDGSIKNNYNFKVNLSTIFSDVDSMEMRKREIKAKRI